jgi:hypothetical protein
MTVNIQIRDVPETVRDRLMAHAADKGMSMQGYLLSLIAHVAARPTKADWAALAEARAGAPVDTAEVLAVLRTEGRGESAR